MTSLSKKARIAGLLYILASAVGYVRFAGFLFPAHEETVFATGAPFRMGELATMLWLVIMGAREQQSHASELEGRKTT